MSDQSRTGNLSVAVGWRHGFVLLLLVVGLGLASLGTIWVISTGSPRPVPLEVFLPFLLVGAFVAWKVPDNSVGWLMLTAGLLGGLSQMLRGYWLISTASGLPSRTAVWSLWLDNWSSGFSFLLVIALVPLLFPTGKLPSRRWVWLKWVLWGFFVIMVVFAGAADPCGNLYWDNVCPPEETIPNPLNPPAWMQTEWLEPLVALPILITILVSAVTAMVSRFRSSDSVLRAQMKWYLLSMITFAALFVSEAAFEIPALAFSASMLLMPIGIAVGILKYRLYDIDRIISRTLAYALVVALLASVYAGIVALASLALPTNSGLAVAAATLAVAALFNPLRKRIQRIVDKRFHRSKYQADQVTDEFAARLRLSLTTEELTDAWANTVDRHFKPSRSGIWLKPN